MTHFQPNCCDIAWKPKFSSHYARMCESKTKSVWFRDWVHPLVGPHELMKLFRKIIIRYKFSSVLGINLCPLFFLFSFVPYNIWSDGMWWRFNAVDLRQSLVSSDHSQKKTPSFNSKFSLFMHSTHYFRLCADSACFRVWHYYFSD